MYDVYYGKKGVSHGYMDLQEKTQKLIGDIQVLYFHLFKIKLMFFLAITP